MADTYPHLTVATIIERNQDGKQEFLMVKETSQKRLVINQPAGHVEVGETLQQAAIREALEETGYEVELSHLVGIYHYHARNGNHYCRICFAGKATKQVSDKPLDSDIEESFWLQTTDFENYTHRGSLVQRCLEDHLAGKQYPLTVCEGYV